MPPQGKTSLRSYAELVQMLAEMGVAHRADAERQTIDIPPETPDLPAPMHLRWEKRHPFLQLIQPIVVDVPVDRLRDVETAVVRLNHVAMHPGIALDHAARAVYYRVTAVVLVDGIRLDLVQAYFQGLVINARQLRAPLLKVIAGLAGDRVLDVTT